jgi:hypothetical protein
LGLGVRGLGFGVKGFGFRVWGFHMNFAVVELSVLLCGAGLEFPINCFDLDVEFPIFIFFRGLGFPFNRLV